MKDPNMTEPDYPLCREFQIDTIMVPSIQNAECKNDLGIKWCDVLVTKSFSQI